MSVDGCIPEQVCVCVPELVLSPLPIRLNSSALFPRELCSPEWVIPQTQLFYLERMLRLPTAQGCSGGCWLNST